MTLLELKRYGIQELKKASIDESEEKAKILLQYLLKYDNVKMIVNKDEIIPNEEIMDYEKMLNKLKEDMPLQYITNEANFMGLKFFVDERVLIPRYDTEILVEEVIQISKNIKNNPIKILDICTGSGAIAVALKKYISNSIVYAIDISKDALTVANKNAVNNNVEINFIHSNMFENINEKFDIIVSNPPYIRKDVIKTLNNDVKKEPSIALDGGVDGLEFYKILATESKRYLNSNGYIAVEIGYDQKKQVEGLYKENMWNEIYSKVDYSGNDRIVVAKG